MFNALIICDGVYVALALNVQNFLENLSVFNYREIFSEPRPWAFHELCENVHCWFWWTMLQ